jgi:thiol:disulfide interchange protein
MEVYKAIAEVAGELAQTGISKDSKNQSQGFMFRGIDAVYNHLAPLLAKHKLVILPRCIERECVERQTARGGVMFSVTVKAEFDMVSALDGSKHTIATYGEAMDSADKATNKAMSAAYKYAAFQAFCIPTEETAVDADAETHHVRQHKPLADIKTWLDSMEAAKDKKTLAAAAKAAWEATQDDLITEHFELLKLKFTSPKESA